MPDAVLKTVVPGQNQNNPTGIQSPGGTATVVEGPVTITDTQAKFINTPGLLSFYPDYQIINRYEKDLGTWMMGITSPNGFQGQSVAFAQTNSNTLLWICDWTAVCVGTQPVIPSPIPLDSNWVLLDEHYEPASVTVMADGVTPRYRFSGTYFFGHKNPSPQTYQNLCFGLPPYLRDTFQTGRNVPAETLQQGLADNPQQSVSTLKVGFV